MGIQFTNNAEGTLADGITDSATALTLEAGDGILFPAASVAGSTYFYATLIKNTGAREIIKVTEHVGGEDTFTVIVRAQDDTGAIAFSTAEKCEVRFPKIILEEFRDDIESNLTAIESNDSDISDVESKATADEQVLYGPTGLVIFMYNPADEVPDGWSVYDTVGDCLLALIDQDSGGLQYDVAGGTGSEIGAWAPTEHVHTGPEHTHVAQAHTHTSPVHTHTTTPLALSEAEMPSHSHSMTSQLVWVHEIIGGGEHRDMVEINFAGTPIYVGSTGSGDEHDHGDTSEGSEDELTNTGVAAVGTITFIDGMTDAETIVVGTETFEFDISENGVEGGNTVVGDSTTTTKELAAATLAALPPDAAVTFVDNEDGTVTVTADDVGDPGNSILFTEDGGHIAMDGSGNLGGTVAGSEQSELATAASGTGQTGQSGAPSTDRPLAVGGLLIERD
jgi:hypothetical protein